MNQRGSYLFAMMGLVFFAGIAVMSTVMLSQVHYTMDIKNKLDQERSKQISLATGRSEMGSEYESIASRYKDKSQSSPTSSPDLTAYQKKVSGMNPFALIGEARNVARRNALHRLINDVRFYENEEGGLPASISSTPSPISKNGIDLCPLIIPRFEDRILVDPNVGQKDVTDCSKDYDTGFTIYYQDHKVVIAAPLTENEPPLTVSDFD